MQISVISHAEMQIAAIRHPHRQKTEEPRNITTTPASPDGDQNEFYRYAAMGAALFLQRSQMVGDILLAEPQCAGYPVCMTDA